LAIAIAGCLGLVSIACEGDALEESSEVTLVSQSLGANACGSFASFDYSTVWPALKNRYLTGQGAPAGCLRVRRPNNNNDTVSEGIAYFALIAAYRGDRATFDGLNCYYDAHLDNNGLMIWQVDANGGNIGGPINSAATDADLDMALARIVAGERWGGDYGSQATTLVGRIKRYEKHPAGDFLKPGDGWGDIPNAVNPSYFSPSHYRVFAQHTGDSWWLRVADAEYAILKAIDTRVGSANKGLAPDWSQYNGQPQSIPWDAHPEHYYYDAVRNPWRMAMDYAWHCDATAASRLGRMNAFFSSRGANNIKSGYDLRGNDVSDGTGNGAFDGAAAAAAIQHSGAYRTAIFNQAASRDDGDYFKDVVQALGLLVASGNMPRPMAPAATPSEPAQDTGGLVDGRTYELRPSHATSKCADVASFSYDNGGNVQQWDCTGNDNQRWVAVARGSGFFALRSRWSDLCLDLQTRVTGDGANVQQWGCHFGDNQLWQSVQVASGLFKLVNKRSGLVLEVDGQQPTANGANVQQRTYSGQGDQKWQLLAR
jgi:endo-1,4-beta-D-glucanase Y